MDRKENNKKENYNQPIAIKVTRSQKEVWDKNKWIAEEIRKMVREHLEMYAMKDK